MSQVKIGNQAEPRLLISLGGVYLALIVGAFSQSSGLGIVATVFAALLCLGRYLAMAAYARGIASRRWVLPLSLWLAFYGLLALLLYLAGRKGFIFWPALVALAGPLVFLVESLVRAAAGFAVGGPFRVPPACRPRGGKP